MALDYGTARVGVAVSDALRITASPLETVPATEAIDRVKELVDEYRPEVIVVGLPVSLSGREAAAAGRARAFASEVEAATGVEVHFVDERFTSRTAEEALLEGGVKRRSRRDKVDKVAAAVILRHYLDSDT